MGHVGIILSADSVGFNAAEQNAGGKQYVTINWHYNSELYCVIRPDFVTSFTLDVNGYLDGQSWGGLGGSEFGSYGTCDVYINGTLVANDVGDYCQNHAPGTSYEIKDIKATTGHRYNGVAYINNIDRELKGTLNDNTSVRLNFTTDLGSDFYARIAKKNSSKKFKNYQVQYSTSKNFSKATIITVSKKATSKKLSKLKRKTYYYVRVRASNGSKAGPWSTTYKIKTR